MWKEPLIASTKEVAVRTIVVVVHNGEGVPVAHVLCDHGGSSRCGVFGEMRVIDGNGGPRQVARALVLLIREALRYAESILITHVETDTGRGCVPTPPA
jgi:hypothetical protein